MRHDSDVSKGKLTQNGQAISLRDGRLSLLRKGFLFGSPMPPCQISKVADRPFSCTATPVGIDLPCRVVIEGSGLETLGFGLFTLCDCFGHAGMSAIEHVVFPDDRSPARNERLRVLIVEEDRSSLAHRAAVDMLPDPMTFMYRAPDCSSRDALIKYRGIACISRPGPMTP